MGGKNSTNQKTYSETDIKNYFNTMVSNATTNINNIVSEQVTTVTNNIVNTTNATAKTNISGGNNANISGLKQLASPYCQGVNITQTDEETVNAQSCMQIMNDNSAMAKLANQVSANVSEKLSNNSAAKESLNVLAQAQAAQSTEQQGGITGIITALAQQPAQSLNALTGTSTSKNSDATTITKALTSVNVNLSNVTNNENNIKNKIENHIQTNIANNTNTSCSTDIQKSNILNISDAVLCSFTYSQSIAVNYTISCIISNANLNELANELTTSAGAEAVSDTSNTNATETEAKVEASSSSTNSQRLVSDFEGMFGSAQNGMICAVCVLIICVGLGFLAMQLVKARMGG
jgi:hypothetical protein